MVEDRPQVLAQLRRMPLFSSLTSVQLNEVVDRFETITLEEGEPLFVGRGPEENYYVLVSGQLTVHPGLGGGEQPQKILLLGDSFDEETLLYATAHGSDPGRPAYEIAAPGQRGI
jgi:CRP-like cAMP-binding protein